LRGYWTLDVYCLPTNSMNHHHYHTILNGLAGTIAAISGFTVTYMQHVETGLRITTSILGLIVLVLSIRNLWRNKK
jgi:hypothetical protein